MTVNVCPRLLALSSSREIPLSIQNTLMCRCQNPVSLLMSKLILSFLVFLSTFAPIGSSGSGDSFGCRNVSEGTEIFM